MQTNVLSNKVKLNNNNVARLLLYVLLHVHIQSIYFRSIPVTNHACI